MRVLQVMGSARPGGAEGFFARLCVGLKEAGIEQKLVMRRNADCLPEVLKAGLDVTELPFLTSFDVVTHVALQKIIRLFQPDIVMTWMNRATVLCPQGKFVHVARMGGYYTLKYYARCDHLIGNTQDIVDYCRAGGWPPERTHYLPNFAAEDPAAPVSRDALHTPKDAPVLLALGRLHDDKAFDILLRALPNVPRAHLWLAGIGPENGSLRALAARMGVDDRVHFLGWRTDTGALLEAADCLVCPSRVEPLGNVVLEAWTHRKPVVAAMSHGPAGLISDGETGLLAPIEDVASLTTALNRVLADKSLALRLAEAGYAEYMSKFSRKAVIEAYVSFLERVNAPCAA